MIDHPNEYPDEIGDEYAERAALRRRDMPPRAARKQRGAEAGAATARRDAETLGADSQFNPTFRGSKFERAWILEYLSPFHEDKLIADVLRPVKGGKEATVYCCQADPRVGVALIAAKVYRPKIFRTLKNDSEYRKGRDVLDAQGNEVRGRREALAMKKKSHFGQALLHTAWLSNEYQHLRMLHAAGVDVPKPIAQSDNALLMEYFGTEPMPAPALHHVTLAPREARPLFERVMRDVETMLQHGCVHADLSAFNILYWRGDIRIIDLPQAVNPYRNPNAFGLFARDVARVCQYFARYEIDSDAARLARDLWTRTVQRDESEVLL